MYSVRAGYAGLVAVLAAAVLGAAALAGPTPTFPAAADPASPTFESLQPPAPPPPPRPAPAPAPVAAPVSGDEAAVRQSLATSTEAYNSENWDVFINLICNASRPAFPLEMIKRQRTDRGPMQVTVNSVSVNGDHATAQTTMSDRTTVNAPYHMVREGAWKVCG